MSNKEIVIETIRQLPEHVTIEEIADEIALLAGYPKGPRGHQSGSHGPPRRGEKEATNMD